MGEEEVQLHSFLTSVIDVDEWPPSLACYFSPISIK